MYILLFLTIFLSNNAQVINPTYLQYYYMPIAAAAYSDNPGQCLWLMDIWWEPGQRPPYPISVYRQYTFQCNSINSTCSGYVAINTFNKEIGRGDIIVAFKGITNFEEFFEYHFNYDEMVPFVAGGKVSKQFFDAFNNIWINAGMKDDILILKNKYPTYRIHIGGHSVGGAMASLATATIVATGIKKAEDVEFTSFGQPRTGDKDFAKAFDALKISSSLRVVHNHDIIPHLPSLNASAYYHHMYEIWYSNDMCEDHYYPDVCNHDNNGEDIRCSDSLNATTLTFDDHKYYYGRQFIDYGIQGCPDLKLDKF